MSNSKVPVTISADLATETLILDHAFKLVERGVGTFSVELLPGLYKLKFRSGTALVEAHQEIRAAAGPVQIHAPTLRSSSAAPLAGSSDLAPAQMAEAQRLSAGPVIKKGNGSGLFLFVRAEGSWAPGDALAAACLSLRTLGGESLVDLAQHGVHSKTSSTLGLLVELDPGAYVLHAQCDGGAFEQIVVTSPGWTTQLFLMCSARDSAERGLRDGRPILRLEDTSVLMSRGAFNPSDPLLQFAEAARIALGNQRVRMPRKLIRDLVWDKFESPMLGVYAAHALRAFIDRADAPSKTSEPGEDQALLAKLLDVLGTLIPGHPDVLALSSREAARSISAPPMLRSSWSAIVNATLDKRWHIEHGSLAARIPASLMDGTPWLIWSEAALLPVRERAQPRVSLVDLQLRVGQLSARELRPNDLQLTESEEAMYSFLDRRARLARRSQARPESQLDEFSLARAFGATLPEVEQLLGTLSSKLQGHE